MASVKTYLGNRRGSHKHINIPGGLTVRVECLQGMEVWEHPSRKVTSGPIAQLLIIFRGQMWRVKL